MQGRYGSRGTLCRLSPGTLCSSLQAVGGGASEAESWAQHGASNRSLC